MGCMYLNYVSNYLLLLCKPYTLRIAPAQIQSLLFHESDGGYNGVSSETIVTCKQRVLQAE